MRSHVRSAVLGVLLLTGCVTVPDRAFGVSAGPMPVPGSGSEMLVVDVDERGALACPDPDGVPVPCKTRLERMERWLASESTTAPVVVFVHGWHHNGAEEDTNRQGFEKFLADLEAERKAAGVANPDVDGIYVAWRGDQWQFLLPDSLQTLDFPTIWPRKNVSLQVGANGLREVIASLRTNHPKRPVIVAGHSLGASAVFHAVKDDLETVMQDGFEFLMMNPAVSETEFDDLSNRIESRFSLMLSNDPANRAAILSRYWRKVMVLQALGDMAVGIWYDLAFSGTPIGFSKDWQTHHARVCETDCPPEPPSDESCYRRIPLKGTPAMVIMATGPESACVQQMKRPIWVVTGEAAVSQDHNDIFKGIQASALAAHVAESIRIAEERIRRK